MPNQLLKGAGTLWRNFIRAHINDSVKWPVKWRVSLKVVCLKVLRQIILFAFFFYPLVPDFALWKDTTTRLLWKIDLALNRQHRWLQHQSVKINAFTLAPLIRWERQLNGWENYFFWLGGANKKSLSAGAILDTNTFYSFIKTRSEKKRWYNQKVCLQSLSSYKVNVTYVPALCLDAPLAEGVGLTAQTLFDLSFYKLWAVLLRL